MLKKIHRWLFRKEHKKIQAIFEDNRELRNLLNKEYLKVETLSHDKDSLLKGLDSLRERMKEERREPTTEDLAEYSLKTLGIPFLSFADVDEEGRPPHFLSGLDEHARKNWVQHLETIFSDEKFQTVVAYVINLIGNYSVQKADDDQMKNGKIAIIGIRTLMHEFITAHEEFVALKDRGEEFDPLEVMPE